MTIPKLALKLKKTHYILVCLFTIIIYSCKKNEGSKLSLKSKHDSVELTYKEDLKTCITYLDSITISKNRIEALSAYLVARKLFKKVEPVLAFVDSENYKALNQPNILKIEEEDATDIKRMNPFGFQVIEELLHEDKLDTITLNTIAKKTKNRLELIHKNTKLKLKDYHVLWLIRDEITRIALTGITGFDSPVLEQSLEEAKIAYKSILDLLSVYKTNFKSNTLYNAWETEISKSIEALNESFEVFDRYNFIKNHTHEQLQLILKTKTDWGVEFPYQLAFNNDMESLFSDKTFNLSYFSSEAFDSLSSKKVKLGEKLFFDTSLSKENTISCATCHQQDKYFTDGLAISKGVSRNSPTLLYASLQKGFFYDNRAGSLEGQIVSVVNNKNEFHTDLNHLETVVKNNAKYKQLFNEAYNDSITQDNVRNAIANYIRSLNPFNSKFDNNINGKESTLTESEKRGFNLFMGKAKCATCHFPPTFNGTVPVLYKESEMELIGVPNSNDTINVKIDDDLGRFYLFNTEEKKHFFKTPTVRNSNQTGPYMHNGVFNTLEEVIDFYNKGGGIGLGIDLEYQTLPSDKLNLTNEDTQDLIAFIKSLDDFI